MFPLVVHQPAYPSGQQCCSHSGGFVHKSRVRMWCVCGCSVCFMSVIVTVGNVCCVAAVVKDCVYLALEC